MNCIVVTPDRTIIDVEAAFVAIPLYDGEYGVLPGHSPMVGRLGSGELRIKTLQGETLSFFVSGGFAEVFDDEVSLLTARAMKTEQIDAEQVQQELDEILEKKSNNPEHMKIREESIASYRAQLRLAEKKK